MAETKKAPITVDLDRLVKLDIQRLQAMHRALFGTEHRVSNAGHIRRKIAWHVQARQHGGLPESARQHALAIARDATLRIRISDNAARRRKDLPLDRAVTTVVAPTHDTRLPMAGTLLMKEYKGQTLVVKVLDDSFEYDGRRFRSLSAVALEITGTKWSGLAFFGLNKEKQRGR